MTSRELMALSERARVIGELQAEGLHVALPIAFNSVVALVALNGLGSRRCHWIPVKVIMLEAIADIVTSRIEAAIGPTAEDELLVAINARPTSPNSTHTYAFSPAEFLFVKMVALMERATAKSRASWSTTLPGRPAVAAEITRQYLIRPGQWRAKLSCLDKGDQPPTVTASNTPVARH